MSSGLLAEPPIALVGRSGGQNLVVGELSQAFVRVTQHRDAFLAFCMQVS
jgi:hypothetical protein